MYARAAAPPDRDITILHQLPDEEGGRARSATPIDPIGHACIATDPRGRILSWSPEAAELYGWTAAEAVGESIEALIGGDERRVLQAMHRAIARRGSWRGTLCARRRDGESRRVEIHAVGLNAASGTPLGIMAAHVDVRRREQTRVAEGQAQFQAALLDHIESILVAADAHDRVIYWNEAAARAYGYHAEEALGRHIDKLLPAPDVAERRRLRRRLKAGEVLRTDSPVSGREGRTLIVNAVTAPIHDADGVYQGWVGVAHDVTAQRLSDAQLAAVVQAAPFGVVLTDAELGVRYANAAAAGIAGLPLEQFRDHSWVPALHPEDRERIQRVAGSTLQSRRPGRVTGRAQHPDGTVRHFAAEIIPILLADTLVGCAAVLFEVPNRSAGSLSDATRARVLDEISNAVVVTGLDGVVRYWNAAAERRFGWLAGEILGHRTAEFRIVTDAKVVESMTDGLMREGRWVGEVAHNRRDGSTGEAYVTTSLVLDPDGRPESIVSVSADLDPIRDRQTALELQSQVLASIDAGMWLLDPSTNRMEFVNAGYERMFGLRLDDLREDSWAWLARAHPDDRARVRSTVESHPVGVEIEYRIEELPGDGSRWRHVHARTVAVNDAQGATLWLAGIVTDISGLRDAEDQLAQMAAAIAQTRDGVLIVDGEWRASYVNDAFERLTGYQRDAIIGTHPVQLVGGIAEPRPEFAAVLAATARGEPFSGPLRGNRADGSPLDVEVSVWPITGANAGVSSIVAVLRERTPSADVMAALDRQVKERSILSAALARVNAAGTLAEKAGAILAPALELEHVDLATVMAFVNGSLVLPLAAVGPAGMPVEPGQPLNTIRAARIRQLSLQGVTVEPWDLREGDGDYGRRWTDLGLTAVAYLPLQLDGEVVGVLTAGSLRPNGGRLLRDHLPALAEHANMAMALLGPDLRVLRGAEERRARITRIIAEREFRAVFQPIVELGTRTVVGYEALTRFDDGEAPDTRFLEAEALGLGIELEQASLEAAVAASADLPAGALLSLNVSPEMAGQLSRLRRALGGLVRPVILEITERTAVEDYQRIRRTVRALGGHVKLAVDDAGAGFASLRHIVELRPDYVKLDMGLVRRIDRDQARQALVAGMVHYAAQAGCALIGEGIESEGERRALRRLGVGFGQGFLLGRPVAVEKLRPR